jgi:hypothetical protein
LAGGGNWADRFRREPYVLSPTEPFRISDFLVAPIGCYFSWIA